MKKGTRSFLINLSFCIFVLIFCMVYGNFFAKIPELIQTSVSKYKFLSTLKLFCFLIPSVFAASSNISWCIEYGLHPDNSRLRFSEAMFERFKFVIINSLIFILIITFAQEICLPQIDSQLETLESKPSLMQDYQRSANFFYENENYETAFQYARLAYQIDPTDKTNKEILYKTEKYLDKKAEISKSFIQKINELTFNDSSFGISAPKQKPISGPYKSYELMQTAKKYYAAGDWFAAHYYAQTALKFAEPKDINVKELTQLCSESWNQLSKTRLAGTTEEQKIFAKKLEGYTALINGDILRAYYIFHTLSLESKKLSIDPDVVRYLKISQELLENQYFFRDEVRHIEAYETANNVYFKLKDPETLHETVYFIHGVTTTGSGTNMIQYLRNLEIIDLDSNGDVVSGYFIPYGKMTCMQTEFLDKETREMLNIDSKITSVPYIMLNSVDKNIPNQMMRPVLKLGKQNADLESFVMLKMPFSDFELIKQASRGPLSMNLISLYSFINVAEKYGYSSEVFNNILMNRMLSPLYLLVLFVFIASISWHFRLEENSIFKFKWIIMFPLMAILYVIFYRLAQCFFRFINYGIMTLSGVTVSLFAGMLVYVILFVIVSILFLSGHNSSGK